MSNDPRDRAHRGRELLPYPEAARRWLEGVGPQGALEWAPLSQAVGRVLAQEVGLDRAEPPVRRSAMDGFAVRCADQGVRQVLGAVYAGDAAAPKVEPGQAVAVMTGGTVPDGADAVVPVEKVRREHDRLELMEAPTAGAHVRAAGEMGAAGRTLLTAGTRLTAADLGAVAGCGVDPVRVRVRPGFRLISTGDEVVPWSHRPEAHQVRDSNRLLSQLQLERAGGRCLASIHLRDEPEALEAEIGQALDDADLVVTIGGVSMGDKDHLPSVFDRLGVDCLFHGVSVQPGKPVWAGRRGNAFVLGLPGNPVSSFVILELFGVPLLQRLAGAAAPVPRPLELGVSLSAKATRARPRFLPADLQLQADGSIGVSARPEAGSGDWTSLALARALLYLPPDGRVEPGQPVRFLRLD